MEKTAFMAGFYASFEKEAGALGDLLRSYQAARRTRQRVQKVMSPVRRAGERVMKKVGPPLERAGGVAETGSKAAEKGLRVLSKYTGGGGDVLSGLKKLLPPAVFDQLAQSKGLSEVLKRVSAGSGKAAGGIKETRGGVKEMFGRRD